jgi:hypothetical protein
MMRRLHLWKDELIRSGDSVTAGVTIEDDRGSKRKLWYRVPARFADKLTESYDPFVAGTIFTAMRESSDLVVHGDVSGKLLENLEEFRAAWSCWHPQKYSRIEIVADNETSLPPHERSDEAIAAFSGGVDGSFTVYRHHKGLCGRLKKNIKAGVFIHGFNIALDRQDIFDRAAERARSMLDSLGIELITAATNFRELGDSFRDAHAAEIASCLLLFEDMYPTALIASSEPYNDLRFPWGSNPITDRLLSSDRLEFIHDANAYTRSEKIEVISEWPEALKHLRVCWQIDNLDRNCCKCEKCVRTILNFRVLGAGLPECFDQDATDSMIRNIKTANTVTLSFLEEILLKARERSISESWVSALDKAVKRNRKAMGGWRKKLREQRNRYGIRTRVKKMLSRD